MSKKSRRRRSHGVILGNGAQGSHFYRRDFGYVNYRAKEHRRVRHRQREAMDRALRSDRSQDI